MDEKHHEEAKNLNDELPAETGEVLERIIEAVGDMGVYQRWMFVAMMPFMMFFMFSYSMQLFIAATPQQHWCRVPELQHLDVHLRRNLSIPGAALGADWDRCAVYDANWTEVLQTMTPPTAANTTPCRHGWEFLYDDIPYTTIVSERGWVCENAGIAPSAQSIYFIGSLCGCVLFGWMGDQYGRLRTLLVVNILGCASGVATIFTTGAWDFTVCRFFTGMTNDCCYTMIYILVLEYVGAKHRTWVANLSLGLFFGSGALVLAGLALWLLNWRMVLWATSLPMLIVLATPWLLPESVMWLTSRGRVDEAVKTLRKFEKINKRKIPDDLIAEFVKVSQQTNAVDESLRAVLASPSLRQALAVLVAVSMVSGLAIDAILRMSDSIGTDFFVTYALSSVTEIPALALVAMVLDKFGRRSLIIGTMILAGLLSVWCAFIGQGLLQTVLAVAARFLVNMTVGIQLQVAAELIPSGARSSGNSVVHLTAFMAMMFSPYVVYSGQLWSPLPLLIVGITCIGTGILTLLLPETKGKPMPQTIVEAEKLAKDGMLWRKPDVLKTTDAEYAKVNTEMR